jgi:hypothetical protein
MVQLIYALSLVGVALYLLVLGYRWGFRFESSKGLILASALIGAPGLLALVGWWGLRRQKLWGWLVALSIDALLLLMFINSIADDGLRNIDAITAALAILSLATASCLLIPAVRKQYWHNKEVITA